MSEPTADATYKWLEVREHVKQRPDTYCGAVTATEIEGHVFRKQEEGHMLCEHIKCTTSPALFKFFDEIITNAIDNSKRVTNQKYIKAKVDPNTGIFSCSNDGDTIPVELWPGSERYTPEILFSEPMSGSNFGSGGMLGGRNGLGCKVVNILSEQFVIDITNVQCEKKYKQVFSNNSYDVGKPKVSKTSDKDKKSHLTLTWKPDYALLGLTLPLDANTVELLKTRLYDAAVCCSGNVAVHFNEERLAIKSIKDYALLLGGTWIGRDEIQGSDGASLEFCISSVRKGVGEEPNVVGFVNGLRCSQGTHVELIFRRLLESMNDILKRKMKKSATSSIRPQLLRDSVIVVIHMVVQNPSFTSQTKERLDLSCEKFGFRYTSLSSTLVKQLEKSPIVEDLIRAIEERENKDVSKSIQQTKRQKCNIPKYHSALKKHSNLYITEGDSALAMALSGFSVVGREHNGAFPLRGKMVNTYNMNPKSALEHKEIMHLTQILELTPNKEYDDDAAKNLPYRHIVIFTDADIDGSHIMGLILTFIRQYFPSILKLWPDFVLRFATPVIKARIGKEFGSFYTTREYESWLNGRQPTSVKYYKGLGTSTDAEAKDYFRNSSHHLTTIQYNGEDSEAAIADFFDPSKSESRKRLLREVNPASCVDYEQPTTSFERFCYDELIHFAAEDNRRSICNLVDGLKPSNRKILFTVRSRKAGEIKVASLSGNVTEFACYHHGEQSLHSAIVAMAQQHVGTNNMAYLKPNGQYGSRMTKRDEGVASPRYIFTEAAVINWYMFRKEDDPILQYQYDDGKKVEPTYYVPVIAGVLANGCNGVGVGYRTTVPNFNVLQVISATKAFILDEPLPEVLPYYLGFEGTTHFDGAQYVFTGLFELAGNLLTITELPPTVWTNHYCEWLQKSMEKNLHFIDRVQNMSTKDKVCIQLRIKSDADLSKISIVDELKLSHKVSLAQMNLFDSNNALRNFATPHDIIRHHANVRIDAYTRRLAFQVKELELQVKILFNRARFVEEIESKSLIITNKKKEDFRKELCERDFFRHDEWNYLLNMNVFHLTKDEIEKLRHAAEEKQSELDKLKALTPKMVWLHELNELQVQYEAYVNEIRANVEEDVKAVHANKKMRTSNKGRLVVAGKK